MKIYTQYYIEVSVDPNALAIATVTVHDAVKVKAVAIIAELRTWLKVLEKLTNLVANSYGLIHTKFS